MVDQLDRLFGQCIGECVGLGADKCFNRMGQHVQTGIGCDLGRYAARQLGVEYRIVG